MNKKKLLIKKRKIHKNKKDFKINNPNKNVNFNPSKIIIPTSL